MKATKINLHDKISLLNNVLGGLGAEKVTPLEDTVVGNTSAIGQQVWTLQQLITTLKTNQTDSIRQAVEGTLSFTLAKFKAHDRNLSLQPIEADFDYPEAEKAQLVEEVQPVDKKVTEEMQIRSPSSKQCAIGFPL